METSGVVATAVACVVVAVLLYLLSTLVFGAVDVLPDDASAAATPSEWIRGRIDEIRPGRGTTFASTGDAASCRRA